MAELEYAKRLLSAVLSVCDKKMFMMQRSLALLITSAVPQRFPKLRFVIVEGGIGWIAAQLRFMDHWWETIAGCNRSSTNRPVLTSSASSGRPSRMTVPAS